MKYDEYILTMATPDGDERFETVRALSVPAAKRQILKTFAKRGWSKDWSVVETTKLVAR